MNRITLQSTEFINHPQGTNTYGWRIYDTYGAVYDNTLDHIIIDNFELLKITLDSDLPQVVDMLSFLHEHGGGLEINGAWYDWNEIKHLWDEYDAGG